MDFSRTRGLIALIAQPPDQTRNIQCEHAAGGGRGQVGKDGGSAVSIRWLHLEKHSKS